MVDFKAKIKAQKSKDRERAGKKRKSVEGHRMPSAPRASIPSARKSANNSAAIMKGVTDLFKDKDDDSSDNSSYDTYKDIISEDDFGNLDSFSPSDSSSFISGFEGFDASGGFKKGGRLKKAGKRKRAALRGQRSELRGS